MRSPLAVLLAIPMILILIVGCSKLQTSLPVTTQAAETSTVQPSQPAPTPTSIDLSKVPVYSWQEAVKHIGETATVTGPIIDWTTILISNYIVLGMGKKFGEQGYVGIALRVDKSAIPSDMYVGKTISATGYINRNAFGGAAVDVSELSSIKIVQ